MLLSLNGSLRVRACSMSSSVAATAVAASSKGMRDEYGAMDSSGHRFVTNNFILDSGVVLPIAEVRFIIMI